MEQQSYDRIYVVRITKTGSTGHRVVFFWNTSEVKDSKLKIHYEKENKGKPIKNAIQTAKRRRLNRKKRNTEILKNMKDVRIMKK